MSKSNGVPKGRDAVLAYHKAVKASKVVDDSLFFSLPYPPSANNHWKQNKGRTYLSSAARLWREKSAAAIYEQGRPLQPLSVPVRVELLVYPPDKRRRDIANVEKEVADALQRNGVLEDDFLIDELFIKRMPVCGESPRVEVLIIPL